MTCLIPAAGTLHPLRIAARTKIARSPAWSSARRREIVSSGLSPNSIVAAVALAHNLSARDLTDRDQRGHVVVARTRAFQAVAEAHPHLSLKELCGSIGRVRCSRLARLAVAVDAREEPLRPGETCMPSGVAAIVSQSAIAFGVTSRAIIGRSQMPLIVAARFHAIWAVREANPRISLSQIGRYFGPRDHSTILCALQKMAREGVPQPASLRIGEAA